MNRESAETFLARHQEVEDERERAEIKARLEGILARIGPAR